jgi:hypothetical protein
MVFFGKGLVVGARLVAHIVVTMRNKEEIVNCFVTGLRNEAKEKNGLAAHI